MIFWRAAHGEISWPVGVHSPMNLEGIFALALLSLAVLPARDTEPRQDRGRYWPWALVILVFFAFLPYLSFPFLADDYDHIWNARNITSQVAVAHFTQAEADRFFRPLVYLFYAGEAPFAGTNPVIWRTVSLAWHLAASMLVFRLLRRLSSSAFAAFAGAAIFAIHGTRPEAVTWVAALFDLMATTLGLGALVLLLERRNIQSSVALFLALLCKESAFVFPFLAVILLRFELFAWRECYRRCSAWFVIAGMVFAYRWHLLGEIGGYHNSIDGRPTIFNLRLTTTLKGVFLRAWAALFVPLNWSHLPGYFLAFLLLAGTLALVVLAWRGGDTRLILLGILFVFVAVLPVHQFLSIGEDLEKSRVLYLPSIGLAIVFAGLALRQNSMLAVAVVLVFQFFALRSNLEVWKRVGFLAAKTCHSPGAVGMAELPNVVNGVYFLRTGYPRCLEFGNAASE